jgi:hypothetical protein
LRLRLSQRAEGGQPRALRLKIADCPDRRQPFDSAAHGHQNPANLDRRHASPHTVAALLRQLLFVAAVGFAMNSTCQSPAVNSYHEDLPAYAPAWGPPESRFGYHRVFWTDGSVVRPREYADVGLRIGQQTGRFACEEGLAATLFESWFMFGPSAGISLIDPAIVLRGSWTPVRVAGHTPGNQLELTFEKSYWWQVSVLAGTPYRAHGFGWSAGARATKQGIGPLLTGELGSGVLSLRAEASASWLAPWASDTTRGAFFTLGIGTAHHGRSPR